MSMRRERDENVTNKNLLCKSVERLEKERERERREFGQEGMLSDVCNKRQTSFTTYAMTVRRSRKINLFRQDDLTVSGPFLQLHKKKNWKNSSETKCCISETGNDPFKI